MEGYLGPDREAVSRRDDSPRLGRRFHRMLRCAGGYRGKVREAVSHDQGRQADRRVPQEVKTNRLVLIDSGFFNV